MLKYTRRPDKSNLIRHTDEGGRRMKVRPDRAQRPIGELGSTPWLNGGEAESRKWNEDSNKQVNYIKKENAN
jgi:hypothetical protein